MIKRFVLPEGLAGTIQQTVCLIRRIPLDCARDPCEPGQRLDEDVNVICHHYIGMELIQVQAICSVLQCFNNAPSHAGIFQPQWP